jgi:hypothetical protein
MTFQPWRMRFQFQAIGMRLWILDFRLGEVWGWGLGFGADGFGWEWKSSHAKQTSPSITLPTKIPHLPPKTAY